MASSWQHWKEVGVSFRGIWWYHLMVYPSLSISTSCQSLKIFFDHYSTGLAPLWCNAPPWMLSVCNVCSIGRESWSLNRPWAQAGNHNSTWRRWSISWNRMHRISCLKVLKPEAHFQCLALCPLFIFPARTRKRLFVFFCFFWKLKPFIVVVYLALPSTVPFGALSLYFASSAETMALEDFALSAFPLLFSWHRASLNCWFGCYGSRCRCFYSFW